MKLIEIQERNSGNHSNNLENKIEKFSHLKRHGNEITEGCEEMKMKVDGRAIESTWIKYIESSLF